jgi:hypothetical protein
MTIQERSTSDTRLLIEADAEAIADTFELSGDARRRVVAQLPILAVHRRVREQVSQDLLAGAADGNP